MKKQASKQKLISIPSGTISKMTKSQVLAKMAKAEYEEVFTDSTWSNLNKRLSQLK